MTPCGPAACATDVSTCASAPTYVSICVVQCSSAAVGARAWVRRRGRRDRDERGTTATLPRHVHVLLLAHVPCRPAISFGSRRSFLLLARAMLALTRSSRFMAASSGARARPANRARRISVTLAAARCSATASSARQSTPAAPQSLRSATCRVKASRSVASRDRSASAPTSPKSISQEGWRPNYEREGETKSRILFARGHLTWVQMQARS